MTVDSSSTRTGDEQSPAAAPRRGRRSGRLAMIALLGLAAAGYAFYWHRRAPLQHLPDVDLSAAHPVVRRFITDAIEAVRAAPRSGRAWGELGLSLRAHEFDPQAIVCLRQAMQFEPRETTWPYVLASALSVRDRPESERCFRIASSLQPRLALPRLRLGELYLEERRLEEARIEYDTALQLEPDSARAMLGCALIEMAREDTESARRWAEKSWALDPEQRSTAEVLLRVYRRLADKAGESRMQEALAQLPVEEVGWDDPFGEKVLLMRRDPGGMAAAAHDLIARKRLAEAVVVLERLVPMAPETSQWPVLLGRQLIRQGNLARAREVLDAALHQHPESADVHFQSGVERYLRRQWSAAADDFRAALRLKPDFSDAHYNLGHTLKELQDREGAIAAFREAVRFRPDYAAAYTNLGELLLEAGERVAAGNALRTAARLSPRDPQTVKLLSQLERELDEPQR